MTKIDKIKEYMVLCGVTSNREIVTKGGYPKTVQFLGQVLNGQKRLSKEEEKLIYRCISEARAKRIMKEN